MITIRRIQKIVAYRFRISVRDMIDNRTRRIEFAKPRYIAMYFARTKTNASFPAIAKAFKRPHHKSVYLAIAAVERGLLADDVQILSWWIDRENAELMREQSLLREQVNRKLLVAEIMRERAA